MINMLPIAAYPNNDYFITVKAVKLAKESVIM